MIKFKSLALETRSVDGLSQCKIPRTNQAGLSIHRGGYAGAQLLCSATYQHEKALIVVCMTVCMTNLSYIFHPLTAAPSKYGTCMPSLHRHTTQRPIKTQMPPLTAGPWQYFNSAQHPIAHSKSAFVWLFHHRLNGIQKCSSMYQRTSAASSDFCSQTSHSFPHSFLCVIFS